MIAQERLNRAVALLNKNRVWECPARARETDKLIHDLEPCPDCNSIPTITNEPAQAAWEVLTRPYCYVHYREGTPDGKVCVRCKDESARIPHDIATWPDGAVLGMASESIQEMGRDTMQPAKQGDQCEAQIFIGLEDGIGDLLTQAVAATAPEALLDAFIEALERSKDA